MAGRQRWKVVGGVDKGGIKVRKGGDLQSEVEEDVLATGSIVLEEESVGARLRYTLLEGRGPPTGWVSRSVGPKKLLEHVEYEEESPPLQPASSIPAPAHPELVITEPPLSVFKGSGQSLGGDSADSNSDPRARALAAAERRRAAAAKSSGSIDREAIRARKVKDDLLDALSGQYAKIGQSLPEYLKDAPVDEMRATLTSLQAPSCETRAEQPIEPQAAHLQSTPAKPERPQAPLQQAANMSDGVPRERLMCASLGCRFLVNSKLELGSYCCIACYEGGSHGPRCEQLDAPYNAVKASPSAAPMDGDRMAEMELERAIRESMADAAAPDDLDELQAAIRLSMAESTDPAEATTGMRLDKPTSTPKTEADLEMEAAIRAWMTGPWWPCIAGDGELPPLELLDAPRVSDYSPHEE